ncbi:MAG: hypothetical protein AB7U20_25495 [Planctomycetaceae bacterium]
MLTKADLQQFYDFALAEINNGGVSSLDQCLRDWREYQETVAAIREGLGLEDSAAGRTQSVDEAFADIRRELGLPSRRSGSWPSTGIVSDLSCSAREVPSLLVVRNHWDRP